MSQAVLATALSLVPPLPQDEFLFRVDSTGALDCSTIITTALDILCSKLRNLQYHINTQDPDNDDMVED